MNTGLEIMSRRRELGISQKEFAKSVGISPSYLCKIERNSVDARADLLAKIRFKLNMASLDDDEKPLTTLEQLEQLEYRVVSIMKELATVRKSIRAIRLSDSELEGGNK